MCNDTKIGCIRKLPFLNWQSSFLKSNFKNKYSDNISKKNLFDIAFPFFCLCVCSGSKSLKGNDKLWMVEKTNKFANFFECEMMVIRPNERCWQEKKVTTLGINGGKRDRKSLRHQWIANAWIYILFCLTNGVQAINYTFILIFTLGLLNLSWFVSMKWCWSKTL